MRTFIVTLASMLLLPIAHSFAQCAGFPTALPPSDCALYPSLTNNISVGPGETYGICQTDDNVYNYSGVDLNGGTLRICANATISGNWNSGTIVVECGATLAFPNGLLLNNNIGIINYGSVEVTGNVNFQNSNNYFYNETDSSRLLVSGDIQTPQNNGQTAYIKNKGFIAVGGRLNILPGAHLCLDEGSEIVCNIFRYMQNCGSPNDRVQRPNNVNTAVVRFSTSAILRGTVTTNPTIEFWQENGANLNLGNCGSFGNATVVNNAPFIMERPAPYVGSCELPNCRTLAIILPVELSFFDVSMDEESSSVINSWETFSENSCDYFEIMRSSDGFNWEPIGKVKGAGNSTQIQSYSFSDRSPLKGISYYRLDQYDFNGEVNSSGIRSVSNNSMHSAISIYPNPASELISVKSSKEIKEVSVHAITGEKLFSVQKSSAIQTLQIDISTLSSGVYFIRSESESAIFHKIDK